MLTELISKITNSNARLIHSLSEIITENNIKTEKELKLLEDNIFTQNGKVLKLEQRVDFIDKIYQANPGEERDLSFDDLMLKTAYTKQLKRENSLDGKIKTFILLFDLLGKQLYFPYQAYKLIKNKEI